MSLKHQEASALLHATGDFLASRRFAQDKTRKGRGFVSYEVSSFIAGKESCQSRWIGSSGCLSRISLALTGHFWKLHCGSSRAVSCSGPSCPTAHLPLAWTALSFDRRRVCA